MRKRKWFGRPMTNLDASKVPGLILAMALGTGYTLGKIQEHIGINDEIVPQVQEDYKGEAPPINEQSTPVPLDRLDEVIDNPMSLEARVGSKRTNNNSNKIKYDSVVNKNYVENVIFIESSGNPRAKNKVGARGLMQIMPETWAAETKEIYGKPLDFNSAFNADINREVGVHYLKKIEKYLSANMKNWIDLSVERKQELIVAGYNCGMGTVYKKKGDINLLPRETRNYIEKLRKLRN